MRKKLRANRKIGGFASITFATIGAIGLVAITANRLGRIEPDPEITSYVTETTENIIKETEFIDGETEEDVSSIIESLIDDSRKNETEAITESETDVEVEAQPVYPIIREPIKSEYLISGGNYDDNYHGNIVELEESDRELLERIVMGEAGTEGYIGAALVAQCIRDSIVYEGYGSVSDVISDLRYDGKTDEEPNVDVKRAISYVFDLGGSAVQHEIIYFYAPGLVKSDFHEKLELVVEYGGHKFFR